MKDVTMYCNSGSGHGYYGNVKIENALNKDNVVDESSIVPPTSTPTPAPTTNSAEEAEQQANEEAEQADEQIAKEMEGIPQIT